jgi:hypothetical protein
MWVSTMGMPRVIGAYSVLIALLAAGVLARSVRVRAL